MEPLCEASVIVAVQHGCANGVRTIETRTLIAYSLILLMAVAAVGAILYWRYNSYERKNARNRERNHARWNDRDNEP
jgi:hypothetical protein